MGESGESMKQKTCLFALLLCLLLCLCACSAEILHREEGHQLDFTVTPRSELPEEVEAVLDEKLGTSFETACQYGDSLYLLCGYPVQQSGGYSIRVNHLTATKDAIYFQAELIGPEGEEMEENSENNASTAPWLVVKTEYLDLPVIFEP